MSDSKKQKKIEEKADKLANAITIINAERVMEDDDEICYHLRAKLDGLNKLCGKLINELNELNKKDKATCDINRDSDTKDDTEIINEIIKQEESGGVIQKTDEESEQDIIEENHLENAIKMKALRKKIMKTILIAICSSDSITEEELETFINKEDDTLNDDNIEKFLSRIAKKKTGDMIYRMISKKITDKTQTACKSFEDYFDADEKKILISKIREEILDKIPKIRKQV